MNILIQLNFYKNDPRSDFYRTTHNQILSTFRFVEPTVTIDSAGQKVYRNQKYGYEVKFPKNWSIKQCDPDNVHLSYEDLTSLLCATGGSLPLSIVIYPGASSNFGEVTDVLFHSLINANKEDAIIGGTKALKISGTSRPDDYLAGKKSQIVLFLRNNDFYQIYYNEFDRDFSATFDQILSTFRFVE